MKKKKEPFISMKLAPVICYIGTLLVNQLHETCFAIYVVLIFWDSGEISIVQGRFVVTIFIDFFLLFFSVAPPLRPEGIEKIIFIVGRLQRERLNCTICTNEVSVVEKRWSEFCGAASEKCGVVVLGQWKQLLKDQRELRWKLEGYGLIELIRIT